MSAAWVPMEPVEPSRTMSRTGPPGPGCAVSMPPFSAMRATPARTPRTAATPGRPPGPPPMALAGGGHLGQRLPVGPQRHPGLALGTQPDTEHLVQLDDVVVEPEPRSGHVEAPHPGGALANLGYRLVPVRVEIGAPGGQGHRVVLAQVLLVTHLEPGVVDEGDQVARSFQLPVGEHVAVDETADHAARALVVRAGDAVVQQ